jgi:TonB family protein
MRAAGLPVKRSAMKALLVLLLLVFLGIGPVQISAQSSRDGINISPSDERFQVRLPQQPKIETTKTSYGSLTVEGRIYTTSHGGATYSVWSLTTVYSGGLGPVAVTPVGDYTALVWESLLKPARDALPESEVSKARMTFKSALWLRGIPGREYSLRLGDRSGTTRLYLDGGQLYVLVALDAGGNSRATKRFFGSFVAQPIPRPTLPVAAILVADPELVPGDRRKLAYSRPQFALPPSRSNRVFNPSETTHKARITSKPEPQYTKAAHDNNVWGTVVLSVVLTKYGEVKNIRVVKGLPDGLTQAAITAARNLKFIPATKDQYSVSQSTRIEYYFNPY